MDTGSGLAWKQLEQLVCDHYREQGYDVVAPSGAARPARGSSAAFRLTLRRGDEHLLVECRRTAQRPVSHQEIGELQQAISRSGAHGAVLISGGSFSTAARAAALRHEHLQLVDGNELHLLFNLSVVDALKHALEAEHDAGFLDAPAADPATGVSSPLPFRSDAAPMVHEEDWAPRQESPVSRPPSSQRLVALALVAATAALAGGWWLYHDLSTASRRTAAVPPAEESRTTRPSSLRESQGQSSAPGPLQEQARQQVIALEGVTSAVWLPNGVMLLGMRESTRRGQERAARQACMVLTHYPTLSGLLVEIQDTGEPGEGRRLQVSCL